VYVEVNPDQAANQATWEAQIDATPDDKLNRWNDWLEKQLGWPVLNKYERYVAKWQKAQEAATSGP
jgi:hypothetical protein